MQKSKMAYLLLGIFVGWLGVHNFYIGHTSRGLAQLLISVYNWNSSIHPSNMGDN